MNEVYEIKFRIDRKRFARRQYKSTISRYFFQGGQKGQEGQHGKQGQRSKHDPLVHLMYPCVSKCTGAQT